MLIGDSAGFLNGQRLKGIHLAMKSGMLAAEAIKDALKENDFSKKSLLRYQKNFEDSWAYEELYKTRNFHQAFKKGLIHGMASAGIGLVTRGRGFGIYDRLPSKSGHEHILGKMNFQNFNDQDFYPIWDTLYSNNRMHKLHRTKSKTLYKFGKVFSARKNIRQ